MFVVRAIGSLLINEVLQAADRGVRVRMLIDDISGNEGEDARYASTGLKALVAVLRLLPIELQL